ncbi:MAG: hypothetical protein EBZ40_10220 [Gammaproteobacteria bacterium]|nr:hypothetical protein [Gammaproteobacteria bacterium]
MTKKPQEHSPTGRWGVRRRACIAAFAALALTLAGCQEFSRLVRDPSLPGEAERLKTALDTGSEAALDLPVETSAEANFLLRSVQQSDPLPNVPLRNVNVTESGLYDAMQLIAAAAGLSLSIEGGARGLDRYGAASVFRLNGTLPEVLERLSRSMGFFYHVRDGVLFVSPEQQFVLQAPPALTEDNMAGFANNLQMLGARDTYLDRLNASIVFRANRPALANVETYVKQLRASRVMIVYEVNVYQVDLTDAKSSGVNWNRFGWTENSLARTTGATGTGSTTGTTTTNPGVGTASNAAPPTGDVFAPFGSASRAATITGDSGFGIGAVFAGPNFNFASLVSFLRSQGTVKVVSQPRISLMSGARGFTRFGQNTSYVAKVGTNIGNNLNQVTVETERLQTGFELTLFGTESEGTIYTDISLTVSELLKFNKFTALGTDLTLPQTQDREVKTIVRARPGDVILLGGIATSRDSSDVTNAIGGNSKANARQRGELVIALRPKLVRFVARSAAAAAPAAQGIGR